MVQQNQLSIAEWVNRLLSKGRNSFTLKEARKAISTDSEAALKLKLNRLSKKGKVLSVHKGYYLIIAPQYGDYEISIRIGNTTCCTHAIENRNQLQGTFCGFSGKSN